VAFFISSPNYTIGEKKKMALNPPEYSVDHIPVLIHNTDTAWDAEKINEETKTKKQLVNHPWFKYFAGYTRYDLNEEVLGYLKPNAKPVKFYLKELPVDVLADINLDTLEEKSALCRKDIDNKSLQKTIETTGIQMDLKANLKAFKNGIDKIENLEVESRIGSDAFIEEMKRKIGIRVMADVGGAVRVYCAALFR